MYKWLKKSLGILVILFALPSEVKAADNKWLGTFSQDVSDFRNWSLGQVPDRGHVATFASYYTNNHVPILSRTVLKIDTMWFSDPSQFVFSLKDAASLHLEGMGILGLTTERQTFRLFNGSQLFFGEKSLIGDINLFADGSSYIQFNATSQGGNAHISLSNDSEFAIFEDIHIGDLEGDSTSFVNLMNNQLTVNSSNHTTFAGSIIDIGQGSLVKTGKGTWVLSGTNTFAMGTTIEEGVLVLNGKSGSKIIVKQEGTLAGTGIVESDVTVLKGGTVAPGNSIGTLYVNGHYTQKAGSIYKIYVNEKGQSSLVAVEGIAILEGGSVYVYATDGLVQEGLKYAILHANGGVQGEFENLTVGGSFNHPLVVNSPVLLYSSQDVYVVFPTNFQSITNSSNQASIARQLDQLYLSLDPEATEVLTSLLSLPAKSIPKALERLSGEQYASLAQISQQTDHRFKQRIYDSLRTRIGPNQCMCNAFSSGWIFLGDGKSFFHNRSSKRGYELDNYDISMGIHTTFGSHILGIAGDYGIDRIYSHLGGSNTLFTGQAALYDVYQTPLFYILSELIVGQSWSHFKRHLHVRSFSRHFHSKPQISHGIYYAEIGTNYQFCHVFIQPFVGGEGGLYKRYSIQEHHKHLLALHIEDNVHKTFNSYLGVHLFGFYHNTCRINADVIWQHSFNPIEDDLHAHFENFGKTFTVKSEKQGRDGIFGLLSVSHIFQENYDICVEISGEKWKNWATYSATLGLNVYW